jgi:glycerol-3-phosphate dehydrogenase (NAD(P)+)
MTLNVTVFGAGAWGTALANHAAAATSVRLWGRDANKILLMREARQTEYLPGIVLHQKIKLFSGNDELLSEVPPDLVIIATPVVAFRSVLERLNEQGYRGSLAYACKGLELPSGAFLHEVLVQTMGKSVPFGVLSGPSFADEVARGLPCALVCASESPSVISHVQTAIHHGHLRVYGSTDVLGVELGGALKNVMAIAAGICDGLNLGHNARAALMARGLAEIARLGAALGAKPQTLMGLSGVGDLLLTCTGNLSRNRRVGLELAAGKPLSAIISSLGHVAEGVPTTAAALALAARYGIEMPITQAVAAALNGHTHPHELLAALLTREAREESYS